MILCVYLLKTQKYYNIRTYTASFNAEKSINLIVIQALTSLVFFQFKTVYFTKKPFYPDFLSFISNINHKTTIQCENSSIFCKYIVKHLLFLLIYRLVLLNTKNTKKSAKFKFLITQKLATSGLELATSAVYLHLDQRIYSTNSNTNTGEFSATSRATTTERVSCKTFYKNDYSTHNQHSKSLCLNMSVNLNAEFKQYYPSQSLRSRIKTTNGFNFRVYASVINSDFQLIPSNMHTNAKNGLLKPNYIQLNMLESASVENLIANEAPLPVYFCNLLEMESLKLEFTFKSNRNANQKYDTNKMELFTIDYKLANVCTQKKAIVSDNTLQYFSNQPVLAAVTDDTTNNAKRRFDQTYDVNSTPSLKVHVILPIILSFFFVTFFILVAIFFRRLRFTNCNDRNYTCEKHLSKLKAFLLICLNTECFFFLLKNKKQRILTK